MKHNHYMPGKHNPHLPHDGVEIEAKATDDETAQRNADLLVSQLMQGNTKPRQKEPGQEDQSDRSQTGVPQMPVQTLTRQNETPDVARATGTPQTPVELSEEEIVRNVMREAFPPLQEAEAPSLLSRINPVYATAFFCGFIVFIWPTLLFWLLVSGCLSLIAIALLTRVPGVPWLCNRVWAGFVRKAPDWAERARKIADVVAMKVERLLDMLPGSLADRLSLPDFSQPVAPKR